MTQALPAAPTVHTTVYGDLKGVDFSNDPTSVYKKRTPTGTNMISDKGGNPKKRTGWKVEFDKQDFLEAMHMYHPNINNFSVKGLESFVLDGKECLAVILEKEIFFLIDGNLEYVRNDLYDDDFVYPFFFESSNGTATFYMFSNKRFYVYKKKYTGEHTLYFSEGYRPHIRVWDAPNGKSTILEPINLLRGYVWEDYIGDGSSTDYYVSFPIDQYSEEIIMYKANGVWSSLSEDDYEVIQDESKFRFRHAPAASDEVNVKIEYCVADWENKSNRKQFFACKKGTIFGNGMVDSVFRSGCEDSDYSSYVWYSKAGDPTYWPDTNYFLAGSDDKPVMGFVKIGEYLGIVKGGTSSDSGVYLAYPTTYDDETTYAVRRSVSGIGAASENCFDTLGDEPLFLSKEGICGIAATSAQSERSIKNRSFYVNKKLLEEPNLQNAVSAMWDGYYILCVNSHCYVLDGRQKSSWKTEWTNYLYECYYWDNVPASCLIEHDGCLWFGTEDGRLCRFKKESEEDAYDDDGEPIFAEWSTPVDNDGATQLFKTLQKKGSLVTIQPGRKASVDLYLSADGQEETYLGRQYADRFFWDRLDFGRFPFTSNMAPKDFYMNKKKKKYKRLQIILRNNEPNEGFAVYEIVKLYAVGNYSKKKSGEGVWR